MRRFAIILPVSALVILGAFGAVVSAQPNTSTPQVEITISQVEMGVETSVQTSKGGLSNFEITVRTHPSDDH